MWHRMNGKISGRGGKTAGSTFRQADAAASGEFRTDLPAVEQERNHGKRGGTAVQYVNHVILQEGGEEGGEGITEV